MIDSEHIVSETQAGVGRITLNRPDVKNAFTDAMREQLRDALQAMAGDRQVRCIVITGAGDSFCAGGDISSMVALQERDDTSVLEERIRVAAEVVGLLRAVRQPVIAALNGAAAGGGANLALACDMRLGSERAFFSQSFIKIGLVPDWGGFYLLPQLVGTAKAMELMLTGARIKATEALHLGLLNAVYANEDFETAVTEFAERIAAGPADAMATIKSGTYLGASAPLSEVLAFESAAQTSLFLGDEAREGMRAFLDKRNPEFR